ncbi:GAF domain-containing protein [Hymenobacter metallicola]|uniref:GAF domain-containing protein n=1 Tax=Hymenobacter metallicola TaxID=2563114 RepID=A0A4Z0QHD4_9BACT|nr:GAF domain-containing protein [Hymenobacter metallicola]TGE29174.1 GAF domain-containing protein [Hymenobacter metallicola]
MNANLIPENEAARLQAVARYRNLGTIHEPVFDELVKMAASLCRVPICFLSLVEAETVWFRYTAGWTGAEHLARDFSLCSVAILHDQATIFEDLHKDPCQLIQSAEINLLNLQFFVGIPLKTQDGYNIGVLAIADHRPQTPFIEDRLLLEAYARLIICLLDLYRAAAHNAPLDSSLYDAVEDSIRWMQKLTALLTRNTMASAAETNRVKEEIGKEADAMARQLHQTLGSWQQPSSGAA